MKSSNRLKKSEVSDLGAAHYVKLKSLVERTLTYYNPDRYVLANDLTNLLDLQALLCMNIFKDAMILFNNLT